MSRFFAVFAVVGCALALGLIPVVAARARDVIDTYERERIALALQRLGLEREPEPEGKTISFIRVVRDDVFVQQEPWPVWFNVFHTLTRESVIERELLFEKGDRYSESAVQETMRNLRDLGVFALVSIVAVKGDRPDRIGVVVHTRDLWSLRLEQDFQFTGSNLDFLYLQLIERNLFGRNVQVGVRFQLLPLTYSLGESYSDHRLFGQQLSASQSLDLIFNRESGEVEGSTGSLSISRPYYDLAQRWSFGVSAAYSDAIARRIRNGRVVHVDFEETSECEAVPVIYDDRSLSLRASGSYRRGSLYKQVFTAGAGFRDRAVGSNQETGLRPEQQRAFAREVLPRVRREVFPYLHYQLYLPRYAVFENLATFGQSESVRTGPAAAALFELPLGAFGSSSDSLVASGGLGYTWARGDALLDVAVEPSARLENGRVVDQVLLAEVRGATPPWLLGRLVLRGVWQGRRRDTSQQAVSLGGDSGLRGYKSQFFQLPGASLLRGNLEYRTLPLLWRSVQVGAILFYDAGALYLRVKEIEAHHAAGVGLRLVFPQFNRYPFRFDLGVPLDRAGFELMFTVGTSQAVPLTAIEAG